MVFVFPSPITQKWWDPRRESLFRFVFKFRFHHLILWFFSDELWKLKTHFRCFQVMETELWWQSCKYTHIEGPTSRNFWLHSPLFFFFFFSIFFLFVSLLSLFVATSIGSFFLSFFLFSSFSPFSSQTHKKNKSRNKLFFLCSSLQASGFFFFFLFCRCWCWCCCCCCCGYGGFQSF